MYRCRWLTLEIFTRGACGSSSGDSGQKDSTFLGFADLLELWWGFRIRAWTWHFQRVALFRVVGLLLAEGLGGSQTSAPGKTISLRLLRKALLRGGLREAGKKICRMHELLMIVPFRD